MPVSGKNIKFTSIIAWKLKIETVKFNSNLRWLLVVFQLVLHLMTLIDTHIHLYAEEYNNDRESLINAALDAGIEQFLMPNIDSDSLEGMLKLWDRRKDRFRPMFGLHPCS